MDPSLICNKTESWWFHQNIAYIFAYKIITPIYFIFGLLGHVLCLLAFYQEAKKESPYMYQIFVTISETMEIFAFTSFSLSFRWFSGIENGGELWYEKNYFLMYYAAHISFPLLNAFITTSLLLSVCMAADRFFALAKPFLYKNINSKKYQIAGLSSSVFIGFSTSIFDAFRFHVIGDDENDKYVAMGDPEYMKTLLAIFLAHLRDFIRVAGLFALITFNAGGIKFYKIRQKQVVELTNESDIKRRAERKEAEKILLLLTISQSTLTCISMIFLIAFYMMIYIEPNFLQCEGLFVAPCLDATLQIASMVDFYLIFCISKRFRGMMMSVVCGKKENTGQQSSNNEQTRRGGVQRTTHA